MILHYEILNIVFIIGQKESLSLSIHSFSLIIYIQME